MRPGLFIPGVNSPIDNLRTPASTLNCRRTNICRPLFRQQNATVNRPYAGRTPTFPLILPTLNLTALRGCVRTNIQSLLPRTNNCFF